MPETVEMFNARTGKTKFVSPETAKLIKELKQNEKTTGQYSFPNEAKYNATPQNNGSQNVVIKAEQFEALMARLEELEKAKEKPPRKNAGGKTEDGGTGTNIFEQTSQKGVGDGL